MRPLGQIVTARQLSRGEREPTKDERNYPPEVKLRTERMTKELRWKGDLSGLEIISPATPVACDSRFETALSVYPEAEQDDAQQTQNTRLS
jgi:import inner membrane translocase subunit TIM54